MPEQPIVIRDEELAPLAAFMYCSSEMSGYVSAERVKSQTWVKTLFASLSLYSRTPELETICLRCSHPETPDRSHECGAKPGMVDPVVLVEELAQDPSHYVFRDAAKSCLDKLRKVREKEAKTAFFERRPQVLDKRSSTLKNDEIDQRRWSLVQAALRKYGTILLNEDDKRIILKHKSVDRADDGETCIHLRAEQLAADHIQNWPSNDLLRNVDGLVVGMVLWLANFAYGGIHAAAWNDHFPSVAEKWLWRASASYIAFCGGLWVVLNFIVARVKRLNDFWERWMDGEKGVVQSAILSVIVFVCGFSLVLARWFVVIEAFLSIRELPVEAYMTPRWTEIFPHL